jgi:hypothetical protein
MTPDISKLNLNCEEYPGNDQIKIGNGQGLPITHTGSVSLSTPSSSFCLNNVLHVPTACANLLSVSQFAKDNSVFFEFYFNYFFIKDLFTGRILHRGPLKHGCIHSSQAPPLPHPLMRFLVNGLPLPIGTIGLGIQISELFVKFFPPLISLFKKIKIWLYVLHVHRPKVINFHLMFLALLLLNH